MLNKKELAAALSLTKTNIKNCFQGWIYQRRRLRMARSMTGFQRDKIRIKINIYKDKIKFLRTIEKEFLTSF